MKRAPNAIDKGGDILISIHHDSVQPQYLEKHSVNGLTAFRTNDFSGFSIFYSELGGSGVDSLRLANAIGGKMVQEGLNPSLHHAADIDGERRDLVNPSTGVYRFDELAVLRTAKSLPAILIECGIIVNPGEEDLLNSKEYRDKIVRAIRLGIAEFANVK